VKLAFAGAGSAFAPAGLWQSNMVLVEDGGQAFIIDAGLSLPYALPQLPFGLHSGTVGKRVEGLYISHNHDDHGSSGSWLAIAWKFMGFGAPRPKLYGIQSVLDEAWLCWRGGLRTLESVEGEATLDTYFDVCPLSIEDSVPGLSVPDRFHWRGAELRPVQMLHVVTGRRFMHSYGLLMVIEGVRVFLTTDTQHCPKQLPLFYAWADVVFHDCETGKFRSNVHAHYDDLATLDAKTKAKMYLYHYNSQSMEKFVPPAQDAKKDGFAGFVHTGAIFEFKAGKMEVVSEGVPW
jgi:ribonuclease BN (tRNA processing enzyme)